MQPHALSRTLTELDRIRLKKLLQRRPDALSGALAEAIDEALDDAAVVPSRLVSPDIVTMYSQVLVQDLRSGQRSTLTLCYPSDAEPSAGFVSVLSPVGWSLLGLRVGETARWEGPGGQVHEAEVLALLFQPEASGDYTT